MPSRKDVFYIIFTLISFTKIKGCASPIDRVDFLLHITSTLKGCVGVSTL
jgi:hypothetical protein